MVLVLVVHVLVPGSTSSCIRHGYRLEQMQKERAAEEDVRQHLRLEIETLRAPQRIEKLATERLGMIAPTSDDADRARARAASRAAGALGRRRPLTPSGR